LDGYGLACRVTFSDGFRLYLCYNINSQCANPSGYFCP
jgi:hypothetical protein